MYFTAVCFYIMHTTAMAQSDTSTSGIRFGVKVGAVVSEFSNAQPYTNQSLGVMAGGVVEYGFSGKLSVQTEPSYIQQGGTYVRFSDDSRFGSISPVYITSNKITMHNVDIPVFVKYTLPSIGNFTPNIVLGPHATYVIAATNNFERTYYYNQTFSSIQGFEIVSTEYERFQFGATAGLGGEVSLGNKRLMIDLRYKYGITPAKMSYSYIDLYQVQGDLTNHSYYFTIGFGL